MNCAPTQAENTRCRQKMGVGKDCDFNRESRARRDEGIRILPGHPVRFTETFTFTGQEEVF